MTPAEVLGKEPLRDGTSKETEKTRGLRAMPEQSEFSHLPHL